MIFEHSKYDHYQIILQFLGICLVLAVFMGTMVLFQMWYNEIVAPPPPPMWHTRIVQ